MNCLSIKPVWLTTLSMVIFVTITLTSINSFAAGTSSFVLVNCSTNQDIKMLQSPGVVDLSQVGRALNIRVKAQIDGVEPYKVEFYVNGAYVRTENSPPFSLAGDNRGNYNNWNPKPGDYLISAKQYFSNTSFVWDVSVKLRVVNKYVGYKGHIITLVNAKNNRDLFEMEDNDTISLSKYGNALNIRVDFLGGYVPDYVSFNLNNGSHVSNEKVAPFAMAGDKNGDYLAWTPKPGYYTLIMKAGDNGYSTYFSLSFKVVN